MFNKIYYFSVYNPDGFPYDSILLRDNYNRPESLEQYKLFDGLIRGLSMQPQMESDIYYDPDVSIFDLVTIYKELLT